MKYAILVIFVVVCTVVLPETKGQDVGLYMTASQCHMTENECPSAKGDKSCNNCCRNAGCNRGDCDMRNCKCSGCRG